MSGAAHGLASSIFLMLAGISNNVGAEQNPSGRLVDGTPRNRREVQILRQLHHVNVVQLKETITVQLLSKKDAFGHAAGN